MKTLTPLDWLWHVVLSLFWIAGLALVCVFVVVPMIVVERWQR